MYLVPVCLAKKKKGKKERNDLGEYEQCLDFLKHLETLSKPGRFKSCDGFLLSNLIFNILIFNPKAMCLIS